MMHKSLVNPKSIVVVGGSNNTNKPGGKVVKNILDGHFQKDLFIVNPKADNVQGINCFHTIGEIPMVDLAIIVIPAKACVSAVKLLSEEKGTRAFIILSAGFAETGSEGGQYEKEIVELVNKVNGTLIGPNCIGVLNEHYKGIFTTPIPVFSQTGCDLISSSGATAVFIMEAGMSLGLKFANVYSVGNAAQTSVEDILAHMDEHYDSELDPNVKLLYLESVTQPQKLLKHAQSLIRKGARIAAIKSGSTLAGSRAAASHTGAIASSDMMVRALFKKAGIVYCSSREELISVASIFNYKPLKGKNIAVITHAGGSAVMLTDALSQGGLSVPPIEGPFANQLLKQLHKGASIHNPIDFLATGTAEQLGVIIDYCEHHFDHIDAMVVVFGSPGLFDVAPVYDVLNSKLETCTKPIYPVLPSLINAQDEISHFLEKGNINFPDEVMLGRALAQVYHTPKPIIDITEKRSIDTIAIREIIDQSADGFLDQFTVAKILNALKVPNAKSATVSTINEMVEQLEGFNYPIAMKVIGPIHKTDLGGVILNIDTLSDAERAFETLMAIEGAEGVLIQAMYHGHELFIGANRDPVFGHAVLCGLGGVFIELIEDVSAALVPITASEGKQMVQQLKGYKLFKGLRGKPGINEVMFIDIILKISALVALVPEIQELDINPLLGNEKEIIAVDTRIKLAR